VEPADLRYTDYDTDVGNSKSAQKLDVYISFVIPILCPDILYLRSILS
jgi:hypothetical protein